MKRTIAFIAIFLASVAIPVAAQEKCLKWTHPGGDANQRTLEETVRDLGLPTKDDETKVFNLLRRAVVLTSDVIAEINKLGNNTERDRLTKLVQATKKQFFAKEAIEKLLPAEIAQTVLVNANLDTSLYQTETVGAGYTTGSMVFGKDKRANCVVLQPAPGQPQAIVMHHFTVALSDGNEWVIDHSTICSNTGVKKKTPAASAPPVATAVVLKPPHESFTNRIIVWEILGTKAEKDDFLKTELKGEQSRDLRKTIEKGLKDGRLIPYKVGPGEKNPKFDVEFHDVDWNAAHGSRLGINNKYQFGPGQLVIPTSFGPSDNTIAVEVINGEGQITIQKKIVPPTTSLIVRAPADISVVHPSGYVLYTCVEHRTREKCGGTEMNRYYRIVQEQDWTRFNFFVIRD